MCRGKQMELDTARLAWDERKLLDEGAVAGIVLEDTACSLAGDVECARLGRVVVLVEGDAPGSAETSTALLHEHVHKALGREVEAKDPIVEEVADEDILTVVL